MSDDHEPRVLRTAPYCLPSDEHGLVYLEFSSLQRGAPVYLPDPLETARRLADPWRWRQVTMELSDAAA